MHIGKQFSFPAYLAWTKQELYILFVLAFIPTVIHVVFRATWLSIPLFVATIMGSTVAFVIAFKNNAAMSKLSEAQKVYSDIRTASINFAIQLKALLSIVSKENKDELFARYPRIINLHVAWLTTLRYHLRQEKPWDNLSEKGNRDFSRFFQVQEQLVSLEEALKPYLSKAEIRSVLSQHNQSTYCLKLLIEFLQKMVDDQILAPELFGKMLIKSILSMNAAMVGSLRIKDSPYPRNFYSITKYLLYMFLLFLPLSIVNEMEKVHLIWLTIPISMLISWIFVCLEKVGQNTTNPFEGGVNDVPITSISRYIEIDMKEMLNLDDVPEPVPATNEILM